jgi:hypothetical protein
MAEETGGITSSTNDWKPSLDRMAADPTSTARLRSAGRGGPPAQVEVIVKRKGLKVRNRRATSKSARPDGRAVVAS